MERQETGAGATSGPRQIFWNAVWQWKAESGAGRHRQPVESGLGASCDWSRERFTMDEGLVARAVVKVFCRTCTAKGLIYKDKRAGGTGIRNWSPAISDLEVQQIEGQRQPLVILPLSGRGAKNSIRADFLNVHRWFATTRPGNHAPATPPVAVSSGR